MIIRTNTLTSTNMSTNTKLKATSILMPICMFTSILSNMSTDMSIQLATLHTPIAMSKEPAKALIAMSISQPSWSRTSISINA